MKYKLTKEQIIENKDLTLKEMFKEVFESELEVGKWYKSNNSKSLYFIEQIREQEEPLGKVLSYGFNLIGEWSDSIYRNFNVLSKFDLATQEEVKNALVNEAIKRGFKKGVVARNESQGICTLKELDLVYGNKFNDGIYCKNSGDYGFWLLINGKWATIIQQKEMTIEQIEKELGYNIKIVK